MFVCNNYTYRHKAAGFQQRFFSETTNRNGIPHFARVAIFRFRMIGQIGCWIVVHIHKCITARWDTRTIDLEITSTEKSSHWHVISVTSRHIHIDLRLIRCESYPRACVCRHPFTSMWYDSIYSARFPTHKPRGWPIDRVSGDVMTQGYGGNDVSLSLRSEWITIPGRRGWVRTERIIVKRSLRRFPLHHHPNTLNKAVNFFSKLFV